MTDTLRFYEVNPRTDHLDRLDVRGGFDADWNLVRDHVHSDLAALDDPVRSAVPSVRVRTESNRGGGAHLFAYRVYYLTPNVGIDPIVVGVLVRPVAGASADHYEVSGDIAGEERGHILSDVGAREVIGWTALTEAVRGVATELAGQVQVVVDALRNTKRTT
jgi:hypothetical protein